MHSVCKIFFTLEFWCMISGWRLFHGQCIHFPRVNSLFCHQVYFATTSKDSCEEDIWPGDSLYMQHKFLYWLGILRYNSSFLWLHVYSSPFLTVQRPVKHTSWMFCSIISPMISYSTEYCLVSEVYMLELETTH